MKINLYCLAEKYVSLTPPHLTYSRLFPLGAGRKYRTPPATILTYSSRQVHIHTSKMNILPIIDWPVGLVVSDPDC